MKLPTVLDALFFSDNPETIRYMQVPLKRKHRFSFLVAPLLHFLYLAGLCLFFFLKVQDLWLVSFVYSALFMKFYPSPLIAFFAAAVHLLFTPFMAFWHTPLFEIFIPLVMILYVKKGLDLHHFGFWLLLLPFLNLFFSPWPAFSPAVQVSYTLAAALPLVLIALEKRIKDPVFYISSILFLLGAYFIPFFGLSVIFLGLGYLLSYPLYFTVGVFFHLFSVGFLVYHSDFNSPISILTVLCLSAFYFFITLRIKKHAATYS